MGGTCPTRHARGPRQSDRPSKERFQIIDHEMRSLDWDDILIPGSRGDFRGRIHREEENIMVVLRSYRRKVHVHVVLRGRT